jgi:hypothetical protein
MHCVLKTSEYNKQNSAGYRYFPDNTLFAQNILSSFILCGFFSEA